MRTGAGRKGGRGHGGCRRHGVAGSDVAGLELAPGLGLDRPDEPPAESVTALQPWEWEVDLDLVAERLHHAVWANSVDARDGAPRYHWADQAVALGARIDRSGQADVVLPDGRPAICDGGPLDASLAGRVGLATVHRIGLEHRSLDPLGNRSQVAYRSRRTSWPRSENPGRGPG